MFFSYPRAINPLSSKNFTKSFSIFIYFFSITFHILESKIEVLPMFWIACKYYFKLWLLLSYSIYDGSGCSSRTRIVGSLPKLINFLKYRSPLFSSFSRPSRIHRLYSIFDPMITLALLLLVRWILDLMGFRGGQIEVFDLFEWFFVGRRSFVDGRDGTRVEVLADEFDMLYDLCLGRRRWVFH